MLQMTRSAQAPRRLSPVPPAGEDDASLEAHMAVRAYRPRELVCAQGDAACDVFQVRRGVLKVYKMTPDGRRQIVGFLGEGDFLGLLGEDEYSCSAEAVTDAIVGRLPGARLERLVERSPGLGRTLLGLARREIALAREQMLLLGRMSPLERLASFLLRLSRAAEERGENGGRLSLPMSRLDIADHLGLTIETVSRCFTRLRKAGVIALPQATEVVVRDGGRLAELASGDEDCQGLAA
jgi:CRP/FNR family transcriptional regulator, anaerobic regulatory protein